MILGPKIRVGRSNFFLENWFTTTQTLYFGLRNGNFCHKLKTLYELIIPKPFKTKEKCIERHKHTLFNSFGILEGRLGYLPGRIVHLWCHQCPDWLYMLNYHEKPMDAISFSLVFIWSESDQWFTRYGCFSKAKFAYCNLWRHKWTEWPWNNYKEPTDAITFLMVFIWSKLDQ